MKVIMVSGPCALAGAGTRGKQWKTAMTRRLSGDQSHQVDEPV